MQMDRVLVVVVQDELAVVSMELEAQVVPQKSTQAHL
jgi:hypothetical protein